MYSVVAQNADPYLELDTPVYFQDHRSALLYAIKIAVTCRSARDARMTIMISGPNGRTSPPGLLVDCWLFGAGSTAAHSLR